MKSCKSGLGLEGSRPDLVRSPIAGRKAGSSDEGGNQVLVAEGLASGGLYRRYR